MYRPYFSQKNSATLSPNVLYLTAPAENAVKDSFYDHLPEGMDATHWQAIILFFGDFNAQIGHDRQASRLVCI